MKALNKSVLREKERMRLEEAEKALQERLAAMTDEERQQYEKEQEQGRQRAREALRNWAIASSMVRGDYSK